MHPHIEHERNFSQKLQDENVQTSVKSVETMQVNITKLCNQACTHCHVDSSPRRREMMSDETIEDVLRILRQDPDIRILDITGGAPELHPRFRHLVENARGLDKRVLVRHNLTVTMDPHPMTGESMDYLPEFFAQQGVEIVSSLPYYQEYFTDKQRGDGVFQKSIVSLQKLNKKGFGMPDTGLCLNLIYNPAGAFIPPPQEDLERQYKKSLKENFGIEFNQLFALTNMPIHRFKAQLKRLKSYEEYMEKLVSAFNPAAAEGIMCRSMVSVSYDGKIYDCDFNQMLDMPIMFGSKSATLKDWSKATLMNRTILTADHCFGCTAGAGSSCGGNTA